MRISNQLLALPALVIGLMVLPAGPARAETFG